MGSRTIWGSCKTASECMTFRGLFSFRHSVRFNIGGCNTHQKQTRLQDLKSVQEVSKQSGSRLQRTGIVIGAGSRIRTDDLLITNQLLYQLSYAGAAPYESRF